MSVHEANNDSMFDIDSISDEGVTLNCGLDLSHSNIGMLLFALAHSVRVRDINTEEMGLTEKQADKLAASLLSASKSFLPPR